VNPDFQFVDSNFTELLRLNRLNTQWEDTCSYPDFEVRDYILITKTVGRSEEGNTSIVQMTEENTRLQAAGELR